MVEEQPFKLLVAISLFHLFHNGFECFRLVHGQMCQRLAVDVQTFLVDLAHQYRVAHAVLARSGIDPLDPKGTERTLARLSVTVLILKALLNGILRYRPYVLSASEVAFGLLQDFFAPRS